MKNKKNIGIKVCGECYTENEVELVTRLVHTDKCKNCGSKNLWLKDVNILNHRR